MFSRLIIHYMNGTSFDYGKVTNYSEDFRIGYLFFDCTINGRLYSKVVNMDNVREMEWY